MDPATNLSDIFTLIDNQADDTRDVGLKSYGVYSDNGRTFDLYGDYTGDAITFDSTVSTINFHGNVTITSGDFIINWFNTNETPIAAINFQGNVTITSGNLIIKGRDTNVALDSSITFHGDVAVPSGNLILNALDTDITLDGTLAVDLISANNTNGSFVAGVLGIGNTPQAPLALSSVSVASVGGGGGGGSASFASGGSFSSTGFGNDSLGVTLGNGQLVTAGNNNNAITQTVSYIYLTSTFSHVKLPTEIIAGQQLKGSIKVDLKNASTINFPTGQKVEVYLVATRRSDNVQTQISNIRNVSLSKLKANGTKSVALRIGRNYQLAAGVYGIKAIVLPTSSYTRFVKGTSKIPISCSN